MSMQYRLGERVHDLTARTLVMGILNRTPDSFFDQGATFSLDAFLQRAEQIVAEGSDVLDVGGVKAGPGPEVSEQEELDRVVPAVEALHARFSGRLLVLRGDTAAAVETLDSAVRRFAALGMRFYEAAVYVERAEAGGPPIPEDARATLERLGAKPWLARVDALERAVTV